MRIYNNGNDTAKVEFEHLILEKLSNIKFTFKIPKPIKFKNGKTFFQLTNETSATVFEFISGILPTENLNLDLVEKIGFSAGELNWKVFNLNLTKEEIAKCNTLPYHDLWKVHSKIMQSENFYNTVNSDLFNNRESFPSLREDTNYLIEEINSILEKIKNYLNKKEDFPHQLIHGDLHHENILCLINKEESENSVNAILDFEFVAWDLRAMELAICLSKFASENEPLKCFEAFIKGYFVNAELNQSEINSVVDLIILRIVSNFIYFVGRYLAKEEPLDLCLKKVGVYSKRVKWLKENNEIIDKILLKYCKKNK